MDDLKRVEPPEPWPRLEHGGRGMTMGEIVQAEGGIPVEPHTPPRPHRHVELSIEIGADGWDFVVRELRRLTTHIEEHGLDCTSVSGGPDGNHIVQIHVYPEMTND